MKSKTFTIKCSCNDFGLHDVKVCVNLEDNDALIYTSMTHYLPWYKRVMVGVKYTLGIDNTYVDYKETFLELPDFKEKLEEILTYCKSK